MPEEAAKQDDMKQQEQTNKKRKPGRPRKGSEPLTKKKIETLVNAGITSPTRIAEIVGVQPNAASYALKRYNVQQNVEDLEQFKQHRAEIFAGKQAQILESIDNEDIKKAGLKDRMMALGIIYDKERLERGKSTQNMAGFLQIASKVDES